MIFSVGQSMSTLLVVAGGVVLMACSGTMEKGMMKKAERAGMEEGFSRTQKGATIMADDKAMMEKSGAMMGKGKAMMEGKPRLGTLTGVAGHHAGGTAEIGKDTTGKTALTFTNLGVDQVPDGRVYLAKNGDYTKGVELGKLTRFSGTVAFPIPTTIRPQDYDSVVIWCKRFNVEIGYAFFENGMMQKAGPSMEDQKDMMESGAGMMKKTR